MSQQLLSAIRDREVILPTGVRLGICHDAVVVAESWTCSHLFVRECDPTLVENGLHLAIPWHWVKAFGDVILLRWFPKTPIPLEPGPPQL